MADILIRGMEMPEYCYECPCHNGESGYCQAYKSGYLYSIERPAKCPLVPLPEGHGRLIDADALMEYFTSDSYWLSKLHKTQDGFDKETWTNEELRHLISKAHTIVQAEGGTE